MFEAKVKMNEFNLYYKALGSREYSYLRKKETMANTSTLLSCLNLKNFTNN